METRRGVRNGHTRSSRIRGRARSSCRRSKACRSRTTARRRGPSAASSSRQTESAPRYHNPPEALDVSGEAFAEAQRNSSTDPPARVRYVSSSCSARSNRSRKALIFGSGRVGLLPGRQPPRSSSCRRSARSPSVSVGSCCKSRPASSARSSSTLSAVVSLARHVDADRQPLAGHPRSRRQPRREARLPIRFLAVERVRHRHARRVGAHGRPDAPLTPARV